MHHDEQEEAQPVEAHAAAESAEGEAAEGEVLDEVDTSEAEAAPAPYVPSVPLIAIVGRPNVGKSRLFNRMTGTRFAIVEDMPGVTRDRQYGEGSWEGRPFQVVDTGGFEPDSKDVLLSQMRLQAQLAMDEADVILHVVDAQTGILPADTEIANMLRQAPKPVHTVVNKVDGERHEILIHDFYALGVDELFPMSAEHGRGYADLMDMVATWLPKAPDEDEAQDDRLRIAVVGKPNAGKSTLVNRLLGSDRLLTSDIPGTTRDAINTYLKRGDQEYVFIDTAGVRRKKSIRELVEKYAVVQAFKAMDRADVVVHVIDAHVGVTTQDQRIAGLATDKGRGLLILLNKWDSIEKDHKTAEKMIEAIYDDLKFARHAPVITISALTGQRTHRIFEAIEGIFAEYTRRIPTGVMNRFLEAAVRRNPPKARSNSRLRIYYCSQVATRPPTFMFVCNNAELVHFSYERYLVNALRAEFGFDGVPVKVFFRARGKREDLAQD